jgi:hypothetical protein
LWAKGLQYDWIFLFVWVILSNFMYKLKQFVFMS